MSSIYSNLAVHYIYFFPLSYNHLLFIQADLKVETNETNNIKYLFQVLLHVQFVHVLAISNQSYSAQTSKHAHPSFQKPNKD